MVSDGLKLTPFMIKNYRPYCRETWYKPLSLDVFGVLYVFHKYWLTELYSMKSWTWGMTKSKSMN